MSFFYYSGHGVANPETQINYLIPVDVFDAEDGKVWFESFQQTAIIDLLSKQAPRKSAAGDVYQSPSQNHPRRT